MNRFLPLLLMLMLLLLTGCAAQESSPLPAEVPVSIPEPTGPFLEFVEDTPAVTAYALPEAVTDFLPLENNLLFFSGKDTTTLILVDPVRQQSLATYDTGMALTTQNGALQLLDKGLSWFNEQAGESIVVDFFLQESCRIPAPKGLTGMPLLSADGNTLYYCTASAIRALDIATGISRVLREVSFPEQSLSGLLLADSVLQISITEADGNSRTLFLSSETGQLLQEQPETILPETIGQRYFLRQSEGSRNTLLFGTAGEDPMVLTPGFSVEDCFFLEDQVIITSRNREGLDVQLFALDSGLRISCWQGLQPKGILLNAAKGKDSHIWLLCSRQDGTKLFYCWDPGATATQDTTIYCSPRYTRQAPDLEQLDACTQYARELSQQHGVEIMVYTDAVALQPKSYALEYLYDPAALYQELALLDRRLSHYPAGFLQTLAAKFDGIRLCIVRRIQGMPESGNTDIVSGIQFWDGYIPYIVLAAGHDTEGILYHELCHLIDTVVLTESTAYDGWERANPPGFRYANAENHTMHADDWRQAGWESFLEDSSLSYAKEDRARIMEYAMTDGNGERFQSPYLQAKLKLLCTGIREAFGLDKSAESFLWEQYLEVPLAAKE